MKLTPKVLAQLEQTLRRGSITHFSKKWRRSELSGPLALALVRLALKGVSRGGR